MFMASCMWTPQHYMPQVLNHWIGQPLVLTNEIRPELLFFFMVATWLGLG